VRVRVVALVVLCAALLASHFDAGAAASTAAPTAMRYRDTVFNTVTTTRDIVYGSALDQQGNAVALRLDMYRPAGDRATKRPAIVWVHGGSFRNGDKTSLEIVDEATTFAKKGYVNVSINYRLTPEGCPALPIAKCLTEMADAMHDAQAAVRFLRKNAKRYRIEPTRIAIGGSSAGAVTALNVAFNPDNVGSSGSPGYSSAVRAAVSLSGTKVLGKADPGEPAILLFNGTADPIVNYRLAVNTVNEARAAGATALFTTWDGAGHVPYLAHRSEILDQTTTFLYQHLDLAHTSARRAAAQRRSP